MSVLSANSGGSVCAFCRHPVEENKGHGHCALAFELAHRGYIKKNQPTSSLTSRVKTFPSKVVSVPSKVLAAFRRR